MIFMVICVGSSYSNPITDTTVYEVEFGDGEVAEYEANVIAQNIYSSIDEEGHHSLVVEEIVDHRTDCTETIIGKNDTVTVNGKLSHAQPLLVGNFALHWYMDPPCGSNLRFYKNLILLSVLHGHRH